MSNFKLPLKHIGEGMIADAQDQIIIHTLGLICNDCDKRADEIVLAVNNFEKMRDTILGCKIAFEALSDCGIIKEKYLPHLDKILKETEIKC